MRRDTKWLPKSPGEAEWLHQVPGGSLHLSPLCSVQPKSYSAEPNKTEGDASVAERDDFLFLIFLFD